MRSDPTPVAPARHRNLLTFEQIFCLKHANYHVEQEMVVDRVVELQCGLRMDQFKPEKVRQAVRKLLEDRRFRQNCAVISQSFKQSGGYRQAAEHILAYTHNLIQ